MFVCLHVAVFLCWSVAVLKGSEATEFVCSSVCVFRGISVGVFTREGGKKATRQSVADSGGTVKGARSRENVWTCWHVELLREMSPAGGRGQRGWVLPNVRGRARRVHGDVFTCEGAKVLSRLRVGS